ncbi:PadR family transcriptional regulator [Oceanirhabdus seepicola]|uniref:PadR family transcriptional regulator n=1 Tax=Oceanirhabdus seepicola TaxID=2828781 RepID=A0A9J6NZ54_9CLOT|nr:PadR family transcriptional regulator [Oceanirhabdus seepicola]MCM1988885.1 PadR family transcriptional regulator [Oceanirhabdus seepicola]
MEFIILGLLILKPMTGYEIQQFLKKNLSTICSNSAGSVQTALKKLSLQDSIEFEEYVEKGKNKKLYSITEKGRTNFLEWIVTPMQTKKVKNMELSKLFFLGIAPKEERRKSILGYIAQLETVKAVLISIKEEFEHMKSGEILDTEDKFLQDVFIYQGYTLEYGIDSAEFEIEWYKKLIRKMENE